MIYIWINSLLLGYYIDRNDPNDKMQFYVMAGLVGLVIGGIQPLARSTYAKLLPPTEDHTTYFSFYDVFEKAALCIGLFIFGLFIQMTDGMKTSALVMGISFAISFGIMWFLKPIKKD